MPIVGNMMNSGPAQGAAPQVLAAPKPVNLGQPSGAPTSGIGASIAAQPPQGAQAPSASIEPKPVDLGTPKSAPADVSGLLGAIQRTGGAGPQPSNVVGRMLGSGVA